MSLAGEGGKGEHALRRVHMSDGLGNVKGLKDVNQAKPSQNFADNDCGGHCWAPILSNSVKSCSPIMFLLW